MGEVDRRFFNGCTHGGRCRDLAAIQEFGRTPRINATAGRDHWAPCYTQLLAGGGVRGGQIYGASDGIGAYVKDLPVTPDDYGPSHKQCPIRLDVN